jgi:hypothetical protein
MDSVPVRGTTFSIDISLHARDVEPKLDQATPLLSKWTYRLLTQLMKEGQRQSTLISMRRTRERRPV